MLVWHGQSWCGNGHTCHTAFSTHAPRLLRIVEQNRKRHSKARQKPVRIYFGYFFLHQVEVEVIRGQKCQIDDSCFPRNLTSDKGHVGLQFTKWPNYIKLHVTRRGLTRKTQWHQFHVSIPFWSQAVGRRKSWWPRMTSGDLKRWQRRKKTWSIKRCPAWSDSIQINSSWSRKQGVYLLPLTFNREVTKMTWPKITNTQKSRYTFCWYWCPYHIPKVS